MPVMAETIRMVRSICHLLRGQFKDKRLSEKPIWEVIKNTVRANQLTQQRICRAPEEIRFIGNCYQTYLDSGHKYVQLLEKYYNRPERSVQQTAEIMGFRLPERK